MDFKILVNWNKKGKSRKDAFHTETYFKRSKHKNLLDSKISKIKKKNNEQSS